MPPPPFSLLHESPAGAATWLLYPFATSESYVCPPAAPRLSEANITWCLGPHTSTHPGLTVAPLLLRIAFFFFKLNFVISMYQENKSNHESLSFNSSWMKAQKKQTHHPSSPLPVTDNFQDFQWVPDWRPAKPEYPCFLYTYIPMTKLTHKLLSTPQAEVEFQDFFSFYEPPQNTST